MSYLWIGIAGIFGTSLRYFLSDWAQEWPLQTMFPIGTLMVNLIGCFMLGWFCRWVLDKPNMSPQLRSSITTGFIGSFTTFSTFSVENIELLRQGHYGVSMAYMVLSIIGGLCCVWLGMQAGRWRKEKVHHG